MSNSIKEGNIVYYARIIPPCDIFEVCELRIRTVSISWFVGVDKRDKHSYLFYFPNINKHVFFDRTEALKKVKEAEKNKKVIYEESEDEDYYED